MLNNISIIKKYTEPTLNPYIIHTEPTQNPHTNPHSNPQIHTQSPQRPQPTENNPHKVYTMSAQNAYKNHTEYKQTDTECKQNRYGINTKSTHNPCKTNTKPTAHPQKQIHNIAYAAGPSLLRIRAPMGCLAAPCPVCASTEPVQKCSRGYTHLRHSATELGVASSNCVNC